MSRLLALILLGNLIACGDKEYVPTEDPIDIDGDGYAEEDDCDDLVATVNPGAVEVCDEIDNNCNGEIDEGAGRTYYLDDDGDGYGLEGSTTTACEAPSGYADELGDCDDAEPNANPGFDVDSCDEIDNDCDTLIDEDVTFIDYYRDADGDGFGLSTDALNDCAAPSGYVVDSTDCDDSDADSFPEAPERCDGADNDCDGDVDNDIVDVWYADSDSDTFGDANSSLDNCDPPDGYVIDDTDCDDATGDTNPLAPELCDGDDNNCDDETDEEICATAWTGALHTQQGVWNVPSQRDCELFWDTVGERIGYDKDECVTCEFAFEVDYTYNTVDSYNNGLCTAGASYSSKLAYTSDFYGYGPVWYSEIIGYYGYLAWYPAYYAGAIKGDKYTYEAGYEDYPYGGLYYTSHSYEYAYLK